MADLKLVVAGAAGRMGRALVREIENTPGFALVGASERKGAPELGEDAGALAGLKPLGIALTDDPLPLFAKADAVLDFTTPAASVEHAGFAAQARIVHVLGTTGLSAEDEKAIAAAARHARIVRSGNFSLGVNLLAALTREAARALGGDFDIEICETHHRMKVDAPSGTALLLGRAAAEGRGLDFDKARTRPYDGETGARKTDAIGFASLRGGTVAGDHEVKFLGEKERLVLTHIAEDRAIFARGALRAAWWAQGKKPGLYSMMDVLGFSERSAS
jgi:4-hydroxy-tetrahydrodipicolinate reductase